MILKNNGIFDLESWFLASPPMGGEKQWKDGRSAKELARYMTSDYPNVPIEISNILSHFVPDNTEFEWSAEYVTDLQQFGLGRGEGRNHDAFMCAPNVVVGIEGKADESLGSQMIGSALESATENKKLRINGMIQMLFGNEPEKHKDIRYQLITASAATLLEATKRNAKNAILLIIVFKKSGCYSEKKINDNNADILRFLHDISAQKFADFYIIPTPYGQKKHIDLYFKKIEIPLN